MNNLKKFTCAAGFCLMLPAVSHADLITFNFTGGLVVADPSGFIFTNYGLPVTPIAASLTYDTNTGLGSSGLSLTMATAFFGAVPTFHDISMSRQSTSDLISGQVTGGLERQL